MTSHRHAAVWIDLHEARVFHVDREGSDRALIRPLHHHAHRHPISRDTKSSPHLDDFFGQVATSLADASEILVVGPSIAKLHFLRFLHRRHPRVEEKVVGIETIDHPSDPQLVRFAKHYFHVDTPRTGT